VSPFLILYLIVNAVALLALPRRWAVLPILATACYMTRVGVELGPLHFTVLRILICIGLARVIARNERAAGEINGLDVWMLLWSACLIVTVAFHRDPASQLITRLGNALDAGGLYLLFRVFCPTREDIVRIARMIPLLLLPLAILMLVEKATLYNVFSAFGGIDSTPVVRGGKVRAQGPFDVSILAGTVAAGCIPLILGLWWTDRKRVFIGLAGALGMIYACTSSGPILTAAWGIGALMLWPWRGRLWMFRWTAVAVYLALEVVMNDPPYFLMARIDLTGSSTGWHRAEIIKSAFAHFSEWWMAGTDRTIHWMPYGIPWSPDHTDITNQYLNMGVLGGMPLMLLFIAVMVKAFSMVGNGLKDRTAPVEHQWIVWALGASLFSHAVTFFSISYYDQSMVFLYMNLAMAACLGVPKAALVTVQAPLTIPARSVRVPRRSMPGAGATLPAKAEGQPPRTRSARTGEWRGARSKFERPLSN